MLWRCRNSAHSCWTSGMVTLAGDVSSLVSGYVRYSPPPSSYNTYALKPSRIKPWGRNSHLNYFLKMSKTPNLHQQCIYLSTVLVLQKIIALSAEGEMFETDQQTSTCHSQGRAARKLVLGIISMISNKYSNQKYCSWMDTVQTIIRIQQQSPAYFVNLSKRESSNGSTTSSYLASTGV